jgi:predicted transcriptional regulator of viral defense system
MTQISSSLIWKRLLIENKKIVTTCEIEQLAKKLDKDKKRSLYYLLEEGYITRILRGIFYVKSFEERQNATLNTSIYKLIAYALEKKGVKKWYFALETALKLNNMTHEYFTIDYVITDSFRTTKVIAVLKTRFQFFKRSEKYFHKGIIEKNGLYYSNPEKTVLDLSYQRFLDAKNSELILLPLKQYQKKMDSKKIKDLLSLYPISFQKKLENAL